MFFQIGQGAAIKGTHMGGAQDNARGYAGNVHQYVLVAWDSFPAVERLGIGSASKHS